MAIIFGGVQGTAAVMVGAEVSGGAMYDTQNNSTNGFGSTGSVIGIDAGVQTFGGVFFGTSEQFQGKAVNINISGGPLAVSFIFGKDGGWGFTIGGSPLSLPFGISTSITDTKLDLPQTKGLKCHSQ